MSGSHKTGQQMVTMPAAFTAVQVDKAEQDKQSAVIRAQGEVRRCGNLEDTCGLSFLSCWLALSVPCLQRSGTVSSPGNLTYTLADASMLLLCRRKVPR